MYCIIVWSPCHSPGSDRGAWLAPPRVCWDPHTEDTDTSHTSAHWQPAHVVVVVAVNAVVVVVVVSTYI